MVKRGDPRVLGLVVINLRSLSGLSQTAFAKECRVDQALLSKYERGKAAPSETTLRRMAEVARVQWSTVVHLRRAFGAVVSALGSASEQASLPGAPLDCLMEEILLAVTPLLIAEESAEPQGLELARRLARDTVARLLPLPSDRRRRLLELAAPASRDWAVAEGLCHESAKRAAHDAGEALELSELALRIAERLPGSESWKAVGLAYGWAFLANARRVANDFDGADEAFSRSRRLWEAGSAADRERLAGWRLPDLEASLRRAQQRFPEALTLLAEARALAVDDLAVSRILLKREHVYERMGDLPAALATLEEAAPRVAASGDLHLRFAHRFNTADLLGQMRRYAEAEALLPEVRELAARQGNGLDSVRVLWLEARIANGQGRRDEAERKLNQVRAEFTARRLHYDAALACLDLAVLWLEAGRTAEVRELAAGMAWIFEAQKIRREALAALRLFTAAARREAATLELARQVIAELKREGSAPHPDQRPACGPPVLGASEPRTSGTDAGGTGPHPTSERKISR